MASRKSESQTPARYRSAMACDARVLVMGRRSLRSRFVSLMFRSARANGLRKNSSGLDLKGCGVQPHRARTIHGTAKSRALQFVVADGKAGSSTPQVIRIRESLAPVGMTE